MAVIEAARAHARGPSDLTEEVTPVLTTNLRSTQRLTGSLAFTDVALVAVDTCVRPKAVTAGAYQTAATRTFADDFGTAIAGTVSFDASWSSIERKPMPKVALHPDRWPLYSTS